MTDLPAPTAPAAAAHPLAQRVAAALYEHSIPGYRWAAAHPDDLIAYGADGDIAIHALKPELDRLADYENRITWYTTCESCARILDSSIRETERAEQAEAALDRVRQLAADVDDPNWRAPGSEVAARIRLALTGEVEEPAGQGADHPSVAELAANDRNWDIDRAGEK